MGGAKHLLAWRRVGVERFGLLLFNFRLQNSLPLSLNILFSKRLNFCLFDNFCFKIVGLLIVNKIICRLIAKKHMLSWLSFNC